MYRALFSALLCSVAFHPAIASQTATTADISPAAQARQIAARVKIDYEQFTLSNGLRVVVHTDRKAPVVSVTVTYDVGSADEPAGKSGFAHLFEHLMFNGSENSDVDWFEPMGKLGASALNGSTSDDRTNYFETVPTGALERTLFLESDRMGHLLGAVTQRKLDLQRGVVQNEKRLGENNSFGQIYPVRTAALYPSDHPYGHTVIGSMADLDGASMEDVRSWFATHYGPNNAVVALVGDIDAATARPLMEKYFGSIRPGPAAKPLIAPVPTLAAPVTRVMHDRVANTRLYRFWTVPGRSHPDGIPLTLGATVFGGLASSRLDNTLVRDEKLATQVSAMIHTASRSNVFQVTMDVRDGVDPVAAGRRLDAMIAQLIDGEITQEEIGRAALSFAGTSVRAAESIESIGNMLSGGMLEEGDPSRHERILQRFASVEPAEVTAALRRWLRRPVFALTVAPGPREDIAALTIRSKFAPLPTDAPSSSLDAQRAIRQANAMSAATLSADVPRGALPPIKDVGQLTFPTVETRRLSNGVEVRYASRETVPLTQVAVSFDAGYSADPFARPGLAKLAAALMNEGAGTRTSSEIAQRGEDLGAEINVDIGFDRTVLTLSALSTSLVPSLNLFADIVKNPTFAPGEVDRVRDMQLAAIAAEQKSVNAIASRIMPTLLYGPDHPYGKPATGTGTVEAVKAITRDDLVAFQHKWLQPGTARVYVVSDKPLEELLPLLEARFGMWRALQPAGRKSFDIPTPQPRSRIILVDRKDSPQSLIMGGEVLAMKGTDERLDLASANAVLGGDFMSRINLDLREEKGWAYGAGSDVVARRNRMYFTVFAPVQADKTGPALSALRSDIATFFDAKGVTPGEMSLVTEGNVRQLPGNYQTGSSVLAAMLNNDLYDRPMDYQIGLADRYRAQTPAKLDRAIRTAVDPNAITWVVVGDADVVGPQLASIGLPIERMTVR